MVAWDQANKVAVWAWALDSKVVIWGNNMARMEV